MCDIVKIYFTFVREKGKIYREYKGHIGEKNVQ